MGLAASILDPGVQMLNTIPAIFLRTVEELGDRVAMRHKDLGVWKDISWNDYFRAASDIGMGLKGLGLEPGDRVSVIGENCPEWVMIDLGVQCVGGVTVGIYTTSSAEQCEYVISHSQSTFLFVENEEQLDKWLTCRERTSALKRVFVWDEIGLRGFSDPMVSSLSDLMTGGAEVVASSPNAFEELARAVKPGDTGVIIYTSGTTGPPKGAMLSHENLSWIARAIGRIDPEMPIGRDDEVMSFLPLCHIFERLFSVLAHVGLGYVVNFAESQDTVAENLRETSPTIAYGVPRMWEKFHSSVRLRMDESTWFKRKVYNAALRIGARCATIQFAHEPIPLLLRFSSFLAEWVVFRPLRERLGFDRTKLAITGAAPIAPEILTFFHAIGVNLVEGYGQTEVSGVTSGANPSDFRPGTVGKPLSDVRVRLAEDGEILVKSPGVFQGYFRNPESTADALEDGWLCTGDVGTIDKDGYLRIVDRKKDLIITAGGKNIAPQNIENRLKCSPYITDAVVIGDRRKFLTALIVLDEDNVAKYAQDHRIPYSTYSELANDEFINKLMSHEVDEVNRQMARVEAVRKFRILPKRLYQEDGEVTPTMKVKRAFINKTFGELIEEMYRD